MPGSLLPIQDNNFSYTPLYSQPNKFSYPTSDKFPYPIGVYGKKIPTPKKTIRDLGDTH